MLPLIQVSIGNTATPMSRNATVTEDTEMNLSESDAVNTLLALKKQAIHFGFPVLICGNTVRSNHSQITHAPVPLGLSQEVCVGRESTCISTLNFNNFCNETLEISVKFLFGLHTRGLLQANSIGSRVAYQAPRDTDSASLGGGR
jgi:hypothetical protein